MLPVILGLAASAVSALTAGEAVFIGASVGAATAAGVGILKKDKGKKLPSDEPEDGEDELIVEAVKEVLRRHRNKNNG
jgi:cysteine synthase